MRRRDLLTLLGGVLVSPRVAQAQQKVIPVVGFLSSRTAKDSEDLATAFRHGLADSGYVDGRDVRVEFRWADGRYERLPALASELVAGGVAVLAAVGGKPSAIAAQKASSTVPIVFSVGGDPVRSGLVASYNRPGGNITGVSVLTTQIESKRFAMLRDLVPAAKIVAALLDPNNAPTENQAHEITEAARAAHCRVELLYASHDMELESAFSALPGMAAEALLCAGSPFFDTKYELLVGLAARYRIPTIYQFRSYAVAGGLISYGVKLSDGYRQVGRYVGRILKGAKPADLPVVQSSKFELVINLKTAKALDLTVPQLLLAQADEVIE